MRSTVALATAALALTLTSGPAQASPEHVVIQVDAHQVVHVDGAGAHSQVHIVGLGEDRDALMGWLRAWGTHRVDQVAATVEVVDADHRVLRRIDLDACVPTRYIPAILGHSDTLLAPDSFYFSGELVRDVELPDMSAERDEDPTHEERGGWFRKASRG